jgi:RRXRR protein
MQQFVPVVSRTGKPLMPTTNPKADKLIAQGRALRRFDRGLFYIQLTDRTDGYTQPVAVGIDPGSKKEAITVKSEAHTYLNLQADAVTWVSEAEATSTTMRRGRRGRKTPYRKCRPNRHQGQFKLPPSTRARWGWKLRLCIWLARYYPMDTFVVEDIQAVTQAGKRRWNEIFSPLEVGKQWFYDQLEQLGQVELVQGYETAQGRRELGLKKIKDKLSDKFEAHCVDSWVLANLWSGGHLVPDNQAMLYIVPLRFHRRQLHRLQSEKGGIRKPYGGTNSLDFKRGSWVQHPHYGICYIGGSLKGRLSLHNLQDGKRLCQNAKPEDCQFITRASWRIRKEEQRLPHPSSDGCLRR